MKTPIQELIEKLEKQAKATENLAGQIAYFRSCMIAMELLEKERKFDYNKMFANCNLPNEQLQWE